MLTPLKISKLSFQHLIGFMSEVVKILRDQSWKISLDSFASLLNKVWFQIWLLAREHTRVQGPNKIPYFQLISVISKMEKLAAEAPVFQIRTLIEYELNIMRDC